MASISIAQWALESGWGSHMSGKHNPFGIKALPGHSCTARMTWEVVRGQHKKMVQNFCDFGSVMEAFDLHGKLLATGKPYAAAHKCIANADAYAHALTGRYATDPQYGEKLISIMRGHNLYQFNHA